MSLNATCQRCWKQDMHWLINRAELHVGTVRHYHVMLCPKCMDIVEQAVVLALQRPPNPANVPASRPSPQAE
jgi:hypothetical protein